MHQRDTYKLPIEIIRVEFVNIIFDIGSSNFLGYDTIVSAVQIADNFITYPHSRKSFIDSCSTLTINPTPQYYSLELAYATLSIVSKANEDRSLSTSTLIAKAANKYVLKIEHELCFILNFHIRVDNFMTLIGSLLCNPDDVCIHLEDIFWDLSKFICLDENLIKMDPITLVLGIILIYKYGKLKVIKDIRKRYFQNMIRDLAYEFETTTENVLDRYIDFKNK